MNTFTPLISIVMPAYNAEKHIASSINSILNQSYKNWELIIVNDGSTDNTSGVINEFNNDKIKVITQINKGVSEARNNGINLSAGNLIAFIDSDDAYEPLFLEKLLDTHLKKNVNCTYCGSLDRLGNVTKHHHNQFNDRNLLFHYLRQDTLFHPRSILINKNFIIENQLYFDKSFRIGEDIVFLTRLLCLTDPAPVKEYLYIYNHNPESVMNRDWHVEDYLNEISAWERVIEIIKSEYKGDITHPTVDVLAQSKVLYYKLKFLWMMILKGNFSVIKNRDVLFLSYSKETLALIPKKYSGYRRKIIESNNLIIWNILHWISKLKK